MINNLDLANLAERVYEDSVMHSWNHGQVFDFGNGREYKLVDSDVNVTTGYQGAFFSALGTGEVVMASAGTLFNIADAPADFCANFQIGIGQLADQYVAAAIP